MRSHLYSLLADWMRQDGNLIFLTADIGGGLYKELYKLFPKRTINVGIAEQNMIGMAAGLTDMGFRVICYSKACFITLRVVDQIKNALCYPQKNVILIGADAGLDESNAGPSHIAMEDMGVLSSLSSIDVFMPSTRYSLERILISCKESNYPAYIRLNKQEVDVALLKIQEISAFAYYVKKKSKKERVILTYGCSVNNAIEYANNSADVSVIAVDALRIDSFLLMEICNYKTIIVYEEQFESNGLYDQLCRVFVSNGIDNLLMHESVMDTYPIQCNYRNTTICCTYERAQGNG